MKDAKKSSYSTMICVNKGTFEWVFTCGSAFFYFEIIFVVPGPLYRL